MPILLLLFIVGVSSAFGLPWDEDLFKQQSYKPNEMVRSPAKGTVPIGRTPFTMTTEEAAEQLENPVQATRDSLWRGRRLYNVHCLTCHGPDAKGDGPVGPLLGVPSLLESLYLERPDGHTFGYIFHGGANMPRYGYKFSSEEIWNIINYLRTIQKPAMVERLKEASVSESSQISTDALSGEMQQ
jgi:mono/diheme cytochrome c family protein